MFLRLYPVFRIFACGRIGRPYDGYVMYSRNANGPFSRNSHKDELEIAEDSDEETVDMHGEAES